MAKYIVIPVKDGMFSYDLDTDTPMVYNLIPMETAVMSMNVYDFFSENGTIDFEISGIDKDPNVTVTGMPLTKVLQQHYVDLKSAPKPDYELNVTLSVDDKYIDEKYAQIRAYNRMMYEWEAERAAGYGSLVGLYIMANVTWFPNYYDLTPYFDAYNKTESFRKFAGHLYDQYIKAAQESTQLAIGKHYPDVAALDTTGVKRTLSSVIGGRIALIDLWASWCGPCRRNSMALIPVYEKFAPKGFTIVGLAREFGNDAAMRKAMIKDSYPWQSLVEFNDSDLIWSKFGVPNAPGRTLLVDQKGTILAIDPTVEQVEETLTNLLPAD
ncbi:MAG: AhpC/TSA family protein [Bacteroides sp.]|nr:AhpC/TSA family protein [Bacteroides sp.]